MDPMGFDAGDPNLYRYVANNTINSTDPSGLAPLPLPKALPPGFEDLNVKWMEGDAQVGWKNSKGESIRWEGRHPTHGPHWDYQGATDETGVRVKIRVKGSGPGLDPKDAAALESVNKARARANLTPRGCIAGAFAAITVYMTLREALQASGNLKPDYVVEEEEKYFVRGPNVFKVTAQPFLAMSFARYRREYTAGPFAGRWEKITEAEFEAYQKEDEAEWGKVIEGSFFRDPKFIAGRSRKTIPFFETDSWGTRRLVGWLDDKGIHRFNTRPGFMDS